MGHFLHLAWSDTSNLALAEGLVAEAQARGFVPVQVMEQAWLGTKGPRPLAVHHPAGEHLLVLGDLFDALDGDRTPIPTHGDDADRARALIRRYWGRYIGMFRTPRGQVRQILRDPSGAHECAAWRYEGVQVVTSELSDWLLESAAPPVQIDWDVVGGLLRDPINATAASPLIGIRVAEAGDLTDLNARRTTPLWRPVDFTASVTSDPREAAAWLRGRIDGCLAFCVRTEAGEVVTLRVTSPYDYKRIKAGEMVRPGFRIIAEEYRKPGLALASATVQDKQALWRQFLAWAQQEQLDPATFQAAKKDSNALARFLAAQPSDIIGRIVIPADIAEMLLRRS